MIIDNHLIDEIQKKAETSPRLRANLCLHKSPEDKVQKMINVLLPGTEMPIHRHLNSDETLALLRGKLIVIYFDEKGLVTERIEMSQASGISVIDIPKGQWHNVEVKEPVALLETKEGPYRPFLESEIIAVR